jgi:hypothetical protein
MVRYDTLKRDARNTVGGIEVIRLLRDQPFKPFRLRISNGGTYDVRHPDMAIVTPTAVYVGIPPKDPNVPFAKDIVTVSLDHVVEMEYLSPLTKKKS